MNVMQIPCNVSNYRHGRLAAIEYIVLHYTSNKGDTAKNNGDYYSRTSGLNASAHFFVDENGVVMSVQESDTAWHCGGGLQGSGGHTFHNICTNSNSIGVEMCLWDRQGNIRSGTVDTAVGFVRELMAKYGIDVDHVIRHYDVTGKICPKPWVEDENLWQDFKERLVDDMTEDRAREIFKEELQKSISGADTAVSPALKDKWDKATQAGIVDGTRPGGLMTREVGAAMAVNAKG